MIFYEQGVKETNWSATDVVKGVDGVERRWVYLHYFKEGQPSINWLDPSFAGMRLVMGDALHALADLGSGALRLDANGFLGVEKSAEGGMPAWSEGHPLSEAANQLIASMIRKTGGFSFQELNLTIDDIRTMSGVRRRSLLRLRQSPAYHHALVMARHRVPAPHPAPVGRRRGGAGLAGARPAEPRRTHPRARALRRRTRRRRVPLPRQADHGRRSRRADPLRPGQPPHRRGRPYNLTFTTNGIACTTVSMIAAALGYRSLDEIGPEESERIKRAHLLLAMFNALQPGRVRALGWDLAGMLTIDPNQVRDLIADGDTRWINRGAHDLIGVDDTEVRWGRLPKGRSLYGDLPEQLADHHSFASQLSRIIEVRRRHEIHLGDQLDVPETSHRAMLVLIHELPSRQQHVLALNFSGEDIWGAVQSKVLVPSSRVSDMFGGWEGETAVDALNSFHLALAPFQGFSLLVQPPMGPEPDPEAELHAGTQNPRRRTRRDRPADCGAPSRPASRGQRRLVQRGGEATPGVARELRLDAELVEQPDEQTPDVVLGAVGLRQGADQQDRSLAHDHRCPARRRRR